MNLSAIPSVDESRDIFTGREFYSLLISGFGDYARVSICTYSLGEVYEYDYTVGGTPQLTNLYDSLRRLRPRLLVGHRDGDHDTQTRARRLARIKEYEVRYLRNTHAKIYYFSAGRKSRLFIGSMNLAHPYNKEFMIEAKGPSKKWLVNEFQKLWEKASPIK